MTSVLVAFVKRIASYIGIVVAALGAISGCVAAIQWGIGAVGLFPVALIGTFVLGCILTASLFHARGSARFP